jgi:tetratricopeptide (TPR) repeat protein
MFRHRLAGTRTMIVLDNVASEAQVRPLVPASAGCVVLVTSRRRLRALDESYQLSLDVLPRADVLEDLVDHNLVIQHLPGRYRLHDLTRLHARALAARDPAPARGAALDRLMDYYQHTAGRADVLISHFPRRAPAGPAPAHAPAVPDADAGRAWLRAERPNLLAAIRHATSDARHEQGIVLASGLATLLRDDGPWPEALALHTDAIAAAGALADHAAQATALTQRGIIRNLTGDCPGAIDDLEQALTLYQQLGDHNGQGNMLISLGNAQRLTGDFADAARNLEEALRLYGHLDQQLGRANALSELGELRRLTGHYPDAARHLEEGLQIYQDLGLGQANAQVWLGSVRQSTGDLAGAAQLLEAAMDTFRNIGSRGSEAWALNRYAAVMGASGDPARAQALYLEALRLARETRQLDDEAFALEGSAECQLRCGETETETASRHLRQAQEIFHRMAMHTDARRVQTRLASLTSRSA